MDKDMRDMRDMKERKEMKTDVLDIVIWGLVFLGGILVCPLATILAVLLINLLGIWEILFFSKNVSTTDTNQK